MPTTHVYYYKEQDGSVPVREWLLELRRRNERAFAKCYAKLIRLAAAGRELRRPDADYLQNGIYELRARAGNTNYRILYFFHGRDVVILAHALTKESRVPPADIARAAHRRRLLERKPAAHIDREDPADGEDA